MKLRPVLALLASLLGLAACSDGAYHRQGGRWFHDEVEVSPLAPASFQPLDARFARDGLAAYYRGHHIADSHGPSFEVLGEHEARDRGHVYYADTYRKGQEYWTVRYVRINTLAGADPASFRLLGEGYAADQAGAWFKGQPMRVRHLGSFQVLGHSHAHDRERGYHEGQEIPSSRGSSFRSLRHGYASDGRRVWFRGQPLQGADAASFQVPEEAPSGSDAHDKHGPWLYGRRLT